MDAGLTYPFGYLVAKHGRSVLSSPSQLADQIQDVAIFLSRRFFFAANCFRDDRFAIAEEEADGLDDHGFAKVLRTQSGTRNRGRRTVLPRPFSTKSAIFSPNILAWLRTQFSSWLTLRSRFFSRSPHHDLAVRSDVVSPDAAGSTLLLRLLKCVYQRALHLGEVTLNTILSMPLSERPTLLIDQPARTKELERALRIVSRPGGGIARKGRLLDPFCPVVLCMAEPLHDRWLLDQAIPVLLTPTQRPLPRLDAQLLERTAKAFQAKLFQYREINLARVRESQYDAPQFSSPTREIAILLGKRHRR